MVHKQRVWPLTPHTITSSGNADGATDVFAADLNGDGILDVLSGSRIDNKVAWYPTPGFRITNAHDPLQVGENGSTDTFTVVLTAQPSSNVVLDIISNDTTESIASPTSRTFTTANWNIPQTVTVTGVNDAIVDGVRISTITFRVNDASSDNNFDPLADQIVSVSTTDNDTAGFTVTQSGGTTQVSENGTTDTFAIVLTAQPSSDVVFDILSSDATEATASPTLLTFTTANWSIAQTVTVTGINDAIVDGTQTSTVTVRVNDAASDNSFDPLLDQAVSVSTTDNDTSPQGDYDHNGQVNATDYTVFRNTFGSTTNLAADGNASSQIDAGDYAIWRKKFGASGISGAGAGSAATTNSSNAIVAANQKINVAEPASRTVSNKQTRSFDFAFAAINPAGESRRQDSTRVVATTHTRIPRGLTGFQIARTSSNVVLTLSTGQRDARDAVAIDMAIANESDWSNPDAQLAFEPVQSNLFSLT